MKYTIYTTPPSQQTNENALTMMTTTLDIFRNRLPDDAKLLIFEFYKGSPKDYEREEYKIYLNQLFYNTLLIPTKSSLDSKFNFRDGIDREMSAGLIYRRIENRARIIYDFFCKVIEENGGDFNYINRFFYQIRKDATSYRDLSKYSRKYETPEYNKYFKLSKFSLLYKYFDNIKKFTNDISFFKVIDFKDIQYKQLFVISLLLSKEHHRAICRDIGKCEFCYSKNPVPIFQKLINPLCCSTEQLF